MTRSLVCLALLAWANDAAAQPNALQIRKRAGASDIVITVTQRTAGAVHSLTWNRMEFIDSFDHGRQMQSASNFDAGGPFVPEVFNPTEAGSMSDGAGPTSTSRLLGFQVSPDRTELRTISQMAFWLRPGEKSLGNPARNTAPLSNHLLTKRIRIGHGRLAHAIEYDVTFLVPDGERHTYAQFEAVTGYMPETFSRFWIYDHAKRGLEPLGDGPGENPKPVVFSTPTGSHAMGVFSPEQPSKGYEQAGYGRFRFPGPKVVKWNTVFRIHDDAGIKPGNYSFRSFVVVGTLADVAITLAALHDEFKK